MKKSIVERKFFRLVFPVAERPALQVGDSSFKILEISEGGCKAGGVLEDIKVLGGLGAGISGVISFSGGERIEVSGKILRVDPDRSFAIVFSNGPTFAKMMEVHREIIARYSV